MRRLLVACLLALPLIARAAPPEQQWFSVLLDGRKIGHFETTREVRGDRVNTTQTLDLALDRAGTTVKLRSTESSEETSDGRPLAFRSDSRLSSSDSVIEGKVSDGRIRITTRNGGAERHREMVWPEGALLAEGQRLAGLRAGLKPGTTYTVLSFQPSSLDAVNVTTHVGNEQTLDLPPGRKRLSEVEQTLVFPGALEKSTSWIDADQTVWKLAMPVMGVDLVLLACDRACALAPNQGTDIFRRTLMPAPRPLAAVDLAQGMRYTLAARGSGPPLSLPDTGEQQVERADGGIVVSVRKQASAGDEAGPSPEDYAPNDWLQSNAPEIVALAKRAVGDIAGPRARMQRLESFVRGYIVNKDLSVGYASALEVARKPEGDCTEHAVLLAALGRALGIATRVLDGLAYAPGFAGTENVFVPHEWMQAWVDGRWQSFDAALAGFDAGHIALAVGDGDPWRFYQGIDTLGRIELRQVKPLVNLPHDAPANAGVH